MASASSVQEWTEQPARQPGRTLHVLVVDDYPDNAESMALLLRLFGHEVETAFDGRSALRAAQAHPPDAVLLDISMPGMDGYEVARRLRSMFDDDLLLIAITAQEDRQRCREAGFDYHFAKPADAGRVHRTLREWAISPNRGWRAQREEPRGAFAFAFATS